MGGTQVKYVNTDEDYLEKPVKKGLDLKSVFNSMNTTSLTQVLDTTIEPNKWNIIHWCCWYNHYTLLSEILDDPSFESKYINLPDVNKEPPVAICCVVDASECLRWLVQKGALLSFSDDAYREGLNLNKWCVYHDSANCFCFINPDITIESEELDDWYDLAKKNGSDNIAGLFDDVKIYEGLDSLVEVKEEDEMENLSN